MAWLGLGEYSLGVGWPAYVRPCVCGCVCVLGRVDGKTARSWALDGVAHGAEVLDKAGGWAAKWGCLVWWWCWV